MSGNDYRPVSVPVHRFVPRNHVRQLDRPALAWLGLVTGSFGGHKLVEDRNPNAKLFREQRGWSAAEIEVFSADDAGRPIPRK
jgi:hypothetical protein